MQGGCTVGGWTAARVIGTSYQALDDWVNGGLLILQTPAPGKGTPRQFAYIDLLRGAVISAMRAARVPIPAIRDAIAMMKDQGTGQPITEETRLIVAGNRLIWVLDEQELLAILKENAGAPAAVVLPIGRIAAEMRARLEAECTT